MKNGLNLSTSDKSEASLNSYQLHLPIQNASLGPRGLKRKRKSPPARRAVLHERPMERHPQITLPFVTNVDAEETELLRRRIEAHMRGQLHLTITDNRSSIISVKRVAGVHRVRLHHMFLAADARVLKALGRYIEKADAKSSSILENFIENNAGKIRETPVKTRPERIYQQGRFHDLQEIYDFLNKRYFDDEIRSRITWGKSLSGPPKHHRSVKMGTYSLDDKIIRIHKALDREFVPRFFVESIVFHEMLHQYVGVQIVNGRNRYHTEDFHDLERRFDHHQLAKSWERENITRLLYF